MGNFCTNCGSQRAEATKFCGECGTAFAGLSTSEENAGKVFIKNSDRRIPVASADLVANEAIMDAGGVWVAPDSEEAKNAGQPFDAKGIPTDETLVPGDCIWSVHPYPGQSKVTSTKPSKAMVELGTLVGRPFDEIVAKVGQPNSRQTLQDGMFAAVWMEMGFLAAWSITLVFDSYGVCAAVAQENAI